jgi:quinol monooxygenase YgiN
MAVLVLVEGTMKSGSVASTKALLKEVLPATRTYEGSRGADAYVNRDDGRTLILVEHWDTKERYQKYLAWREETGVLARLIGLLEGAPSIRYFEAVDA